MPAKSANESTGYNWRQTRDKKEKNTKKGQTPGKGKGGSCVASITDRYMCSHGRSYKHPRYAAWCESIDKKGGRS